MQNATILSWQQSKGWESLPTVMCAVGKAIHDMNLIRNDGNHCSSWENFATSLPAGEKKPQSFILFFLTLCCYSARLASLCLGWGPI